MAINLARLEHPADLFHEVGHYQLAANRRQIPEWGLGPHPLTERGAEVVQVVKDPAANREETEALVLGFLWMMELGQRKAAALEVHYYGSLGDRADDNLVITRAEERLLRKGLITRSARPRRRLAAGGRRPSEPVSTD